MNLPRPRKGKKMSGESGGNYAEVNGLKMYYEIHGTGFPLVVLHGAFMTIGAMGALVPALAEARRVVAVELQGHGHTADVDRPLSYEQMARRRRLPCCGTSASSRPTSSATAWGVVRPYNSRCGIRSSYGSWSSPRPLLPATASIPRSGRASSRSRPELFDGSPWKEEYDRVAPNPDAFPTLVEKMKQLDGQPFAWPPEEIRAIAAPTMVVIGDSDGTTPEHAVELFRLRGGGVFGDLAGLPDARLAVLPGTTHVGLIDRADWLAPMIGEFLDAV